MFCSRTAVVVLLCSVFFASIAPAQDAQKTERPAPPSQSAPPATAPTPPLDSQAQPPLIPERENTLVGWLDVIPFTSKVMRNTRMLRVWLPGNYWSPSNRARKYPVLYMQDGQNLFDKATAFAGEWQLDETIDHLAGSFKIGPMVVVGIDNAGDQRVNEYLPYPDSHNPKMANASPSELKGDEYVKFVITEVMPFIEKKYHVATTAEGRGIGGSSYGAVISLYMLFTHPGVFSRGLIESPPLWVGNRALLTQAEKTKLLPQKMYIGVGTAESDDDQEAREAVATVQKLENILRTRGMGPTRLKVVVQEGAKHGEAAWSQRLPETMLFLYGR